jgi:replicative DNA helicase
VPPHDLDAEAAVLSAILLKQDALDQVAEILKAEHFYSEANGRIYEAAVELARQGAPIDLVQVASWLRDRERLAQIGGTAYLAQIVDATPAVAHVAAHARTVREKWRLRRLIAECQRVSAEGYGDVGEVQEFIDGAEQAIYELARTPEANSAQPINQVLRAAFEQISKAAERGDRITGISTGFAKLDEKTAGLHDGDLMIVAARPGMGKCLSRDAEIVLEDGSVVTIEEVVRRRTARLLSLSSSYRWRVTEPSAYVDDGVKPVYRVTTRLGRQVETTLTHPFLTVEGWRPLSELTVGDHVGVAREVPVFGQAAMRECEVKLLAYLIGDGGLTGGRATFTNTNPRLLEDFGHAVASFGGVTTRSAHASNRAPSLSVSGDLTAIRTFRVEFGRRLRGALVDRGVTQEAFAQTCGVTPSLVSQWIAGACLPNERRFSEVCAHLEVAPTELAPHGHAATSKNGKNPLVRFLETHGLWGKGAKEKFVPDSVFTLPRGQLALFLNRLFATDGWASLLSSGQAQLGYASVSERLARQVQHLLARFGVVAALKRRSVRYRGGTREAWQIDITHPRFRFGDRDFRQGRAALAMRGERVSKGCARQS